MFALQPTKNLLLPPLLILFSLMLFGCSTHHNQPMTYNANSWQNIIDSDCQQFFDGCNQCQRAAGAEIAACTRKACVEYQQPKCLDNTNDVASKEVKFECEDGYRFVLSYGTYQLGEETLTLQPNQVIFSDYQNFIATRLQQTPSGSGIRYQNDLLQLFTEGDQAQVQSPQGTTHKNCTQIK